MCKELIVIFVNHIFSKKVGTNNYLVLKFKVNGRDFGGYRSNKHKQLNFPNLHQIFAPAIQI